MVDQDEPVSAAPVDAPVGVRGTDHVTVTGSNPADTIAFYRDLLGMRLVLRQPNLDRPTVTHLFFDTGDGRLLTFFVEEGRSSRTSQTEADVGAVHHLAFTVDGERLAAIKAALETAGHPVSEFDRGAFHSLYTRDNNGLTVELAADVFEIPDDRRGDVLAEAHRIRVADGAGYVEREHLRRALEALDLPVCPVDTGDAPAGSGVSE